MSGARFITNLIYLEKKTQDLRGPQYTLESADSYVNKRFIRNLIYLGFQSNLYVAMRRLATRRSDKRRRYNNDTKTGPISFRSRFLAPPRYRAGRLFLRSREPPVNSLRLKTAMNPPHVKGTSPGFPDVSRVTSHCVPNFLASGEADTDRGMSSLGYRS